VLLALAMGVRLVGLEPEPPCPTLTGASLAARSIYFRLASSATPEWRKAIVDDYMAQATRPAPLVVESIAACAFVAAGRESVWLSRVLSIVYWVVGGAFVMVVGRRLTTPSGGLLAGAVFLFLPWGIVQSRSFQPSPFAVMCLAGSLLAILRFDERPSGRRLLVAALGTALAVFVRLMTGLFLGFVFLALWARRHGIVNGLRRREVWTYATLALAPAVAYYLFGLFTDPLLVRRAQLSFAWNLYFQESFWLSWGGMIASTVTSVVFAGALVAVWGLPAGQPRVTVLAMWLAYAAYGLIFNFHIATHPYYQTMALPMLALSLAALGRPLERAPALVRGVAVAGVVAACLLSGPGRRTFSEPADPGRIEEYRTIGEMVGHSARVVMLTECWSLPLRYYGEVSGRYWPTQAEIDVYRPLGERGIADVEPATRLESLAREMGGADYFVVTDLAELDRQPALRGLLDERHRLLSRSARSAVYDLR
jgi:hypothetical protein